MRKRSVVNFPTVKKLIPRATPRPPVKFYLYFAPNMNINEQINGLFL